MRKKLRRNSGFLIAIAVLVSGVSMVTPSQSGGSFTIQQSVIPSGGGRASGDAFAAEVSNAQPTAHAGMSGSSFTVMSGFWWNPDLAPTAATVSVSGRVMTPDGLALPYTTVVCADSSGNIRTALSGPFGYYQISDLEVGATYIFDVSSRRYRFSPQVLTPRDDVVNFDFIGF